jgi:hypothetical protein
MVRSARWSRPRGNALRGCPRRQPMRAESEDDSAMACVCFVYNVAFLAWETL